MRFLESVFSSGSGSSGSVTISLDSRFSLTFRPDGTQHYRVALKNSLGVWGVCALPRPRTVPVIVRVSALRMRV